MRHWHFEYCKKVPNPSLESIEQQKKLRERIIDLNVGKKMIINKSKKKKYNFESSFLHILVLF